MSNSSHLSFIWFGKNDGKYRVPQGFFCKRSFYDTEDINSIKGDILRLSDIRKEVARGSIKVGPHLLVYHDGEDRPSWPRGLYRVTKLCV